MFIQISPFHVKSHSRAFDLTSFLCCFGGEDERTVQKSYWMEHSVDLTIQSMMLDSRASDLDKEERPEVIILFIAVIIFGNVNI